MKNKTLSILLLATFLLAFSTCKKEPDPNIQSFELTKEDLAIGTTSVTIEGTYSYAGVIDGIKVCLSENGADKGEFDVELEGNDFSVTMTGLKPAMEYQYHYAVDYGFSKPFNTETKTFTTLSSEKPTVKALEVQRIDSTTYRIKCQVVADGGTEVTERGICWNTFGDPVPTDDSLRRYEGTAGLLEEYLVRMEHLASGKKYYVRAYAKNAAGKTGLSEEVLDFETEAPTGTSVEIELSCDPEDGGRVTGDGSYDIGTQCTATAEANAGYTFVNWTENGNQVSSEAAYTFTVTVGRSLVANFTKQAYVIYAEVEPVNSGTVTGATGYDYGQECTLTATPNTGYDFQKWTKGGTTVSTNASFTFPVTETATYKAHFNIKSYTIGVSANPTNGGTVEGGGTYDHGQSCRVKATPAEGYAFTNWTDEGEVASEDADYPFTVTGSRNLVANFTELQANEYSIQVSANPTEGGTVTGGGTYTQGEQCKVEATSKPGFTFVNWTENGNQVWDLAEYEFTVEGNRILVANFEAQAPTEYTINVSANPSNGGTVTGGGTYQQGDQCTVEATANEGEGYTFINWTEDGEVASTNARYTFFVNSDRNLVANFQVQSHTISVSADPANGGSVSGGGTYNHGESCTVSATANNGYTFTNWTENGNVVYEGANYTFTVERDRTLVAHFVVQAPNTYNVNVSANPSNGGTVTGGGTYNQGASCTVSATAATDYRFTRWTENGNQVSTQADYSFPVNSNRNLVADFITRPTVTTAQVTNIQQTTATGGGNVTNSGGATVTERGICWSTSQNPSLTNGSHQQASSGGTGTFVVNMTSLTPGTTYYVRAYAINSEGTRYGNQENFQTQQYYTISASANPTNGGTATVSGNGNFIYNQVCTLTATQASGYTFNRWTKNGVEVSTQNPFSFNVTESGNYVAQFQVNVTVPTVITTDPVTNIQQTSATGGGNVTNSGGATVTARGVCWSTSSNPTINNSHTTNGTGTGIFTSSITGLTPGTLYHVRAYATNSAGTAYGADVTFTTQQVPTYTITVSASPSNGGTAHVGSPTGPTTGTFTQGQSCTIYATANEHYTFTNWKKGNSVVSTNATYTFDVTESASYTANFTQDPQYTITATANPTNGGSVSGGGTYYQGQTCNLTATPANSNYTFANWTENGQVVQGAGATYSFPVTANRTLVANFTYVPPTYTITVSANPSSGGTVSGGGPYQQGQTCMVQATANSNYTFSNWTEGGTVVSTQANYTFTVNGNRTLVANFTYNSIGGHEYVDLGLPSGLLWATCNVGADSPEEYGDYFAWGETQPKDIYDWSSYLYCTGGYYEYPFYNMLIKYCNNSSYGYNGYTDSLTVLETSDDAGTVQWSSGWRMPTKEEWQELYQNTTHIWTTQNGVNGRLFTATNGNSLFLPAAGYSDGAGFAHVGIAGWYRSSSLTTPLPWSASLLYFYSDNCSMQDHMRSYGLSVRPVRSSREN